MVENGRRSIFHAGGFRKKTCSGISGCKTEMKHMSRTAPGEKHAPAKIRTGQRKIPPRRKTLRGDNCKGALSRGNHSATSSTEIALIETVWFDEIFFPATAPIEIVKMTFSSVARGMVNFQL